MVVGRVNREDGVPRVVAWCVVWAALCWPVVGESADPAAEIKQAATAYVDAFKKGDAAALADQWTERATLMEGGAEVEGRDNIVAVLVAWRKQNPDGVLEVDVADIDFLAEPVARVTGVLRFTPKPGAKPVVSQFTSVRVREGNTWRLAESVVVPVSAAALDELDWLVGTWKASGPAGPDGTKAEVEIVYEKPIGEFCIVGRVRYQVAGRPAVTALEVIHAERGTRDIRTWVFDSTGARAEGVIEFDGTTLHQSMKGTPAAGVPGEVARWVQVIAPTGEGSCTVHAIERFIDGVAVPDGAPLHFKKVSSR